MDEKSLSEKCPNYEETTKYDDCPKYEESIKYDIDNSDVNYYILNRNGPKNISNLPPRMRVKLFENICKSSKAVENIFIKNSKNIDIIKRNTFEYLVIDYTCRLIKVHNDDYNIFYKIDNDIMEYSILIDTIIRKEFDIDTIRRLLITANDNISERWKESNREIERIRIEKNKLNQQFKEYQEYKEMRNFYKSVDQSEPKSEPKKQSVCTII